jgi:Domain of unknown function (DUF6456)
MLPVTVICDADGCPSEVPIRAALKALSQRGAKLVVDDEVATVSRLRDGISFALATLNLAQAQSLWTAGWLTEIEARAFILAPDGRAIVRRMKAGPSPADAGAGTTLPVSIPSTGPRPSDATRGTGPLAWLRARRDKDGQPYLAAEALAAGERLRADCDRANMRPRITVDYEAVPRSRDESRGSVGSARDVSDGTAAAAERVRRALAAVPAEVAGVLMDVCCFEMGLQEAERRRDIPQRSAHFALKIALNQLARHYGLLSPSQGAWSAPARTRSWGTDDFRPTI